MSRLVVIGADPGGMAAISAARQHTPDLEVVAIERGRHTSYSACGIPYLVGGEVDDVAELVARSPAAHRANDIDVRLRHEATALDLDLRRVEIRDLDGSRTYQLDFDHLLLGTGGRPATGRRARPRRRPHPRRGRGSRTPSSWCAGPARWRRPRGRACAAGRPR